MATTTAAQRRAAAKTQFDVFVAACPSRKLLDRISDKWVVMILCALGGDGPRQLEAGTGPGQPAAGNGAGQLEAGTGAGQPAAGNGAGRPETGSGAGPLRYSELARTLAGVSQKMLTQTLRSLERDGLVTRTVTPTVPVTVTYELTDLGRSLLETVRGLKSWAENHMATVLEHRAAHDAQAT